MKLLLHCICCWCVCVTLLLFFPSLITARSTYIVRVQSHLKPSVFISLESWYSSLVEGKVTYVYKHALHGFSATLSEDQVESLKTRPEVFNVYPNRILQLHTTRTPFFLGLVGTDGSIHHLLRNSNYGSDVVIGMIDTGIWPESKSFSDDDLGPIPTHWKGECVDSHNFSKSLCNKKLIGARFYNNELFNGGIRDYNSPRDADGHGTHTSSTAAGSRVTDASIFGYARGVASGIAPKARIAMYKVCWRGIGCPIANIIAAYEQAILDGVDIISFSIGDDSPIHYYSDDPMAIAQFSATKNNIFVAASAGK